MAIKVVAQGYNLDGLIIDRSDSSELIGASIKLVSMADTTRWQGTASDVDGKFVFTNLANGNYELQISYIGYKNLNQQIVINNADKHLGTISLGKRTNRLKEVEIIAQEKHIEQKEDTTVYNANSYKVNTDATAEDLVTKMPGISSNNGTVTAHGETVQNVFIDGKEFFGDDAALALKNLPAEIVDKVQVFDKWSDQAQFTGFDDGNSQKAINIVTKNGKNNGVFGKIYAGEGYLTDNRYSAGAIVNWFDKDRRLSVIGMSNDINQQNFSTQDLLGVTGGSAQRGGGGAFGGGGGRKGGGGGGGGSGSGSASNFLVGQQPGVSTTTSAGLNYSDSWGKKVKITGSYFFNLNNNTTNTELHRQYFTGDSSILYHEYNKSTSRNINHRINLRLEYTIDSSNKIIFTPKFNLQQNRQSNTIDGTDSTNENGFLSRTVSSYNAHTFGYNLTGDLLFQHKFAKKRRTFSINISGTDNNKTGSNIQYSNSIYASNVDDSTLIDQLSNSVNSAYTLSANAAYNEPVGKNGMLQFNYTPSYSWNVADQETKNYVSLAQAYNMLDTILSNKYNNTYMTQKGGISYRIAGKQFNFMIGVNAQYALLSGQEVFPFDTILNRTFISVLPQAMFSYKFKNKANLRIFYHPSTSPPSVSQLQSVVNNNNPLLLTSGNPDLKQSYTHSLLIRYGLTGAKKGNSFFVFVSASYAQNYIANSTYIAAHDTLLNESVMLHAGSQFTQPVNMNGNISGNTFLTYGIALDKIKCNLNLNGGVNFSSTPGLINGLRNVANTYATTGGFVLSSNISQKIDFTISYSASYNVVQNTLQKSSNNNYFNYTASAKFNWEFWKGFVFNTNLQNTLYDGVSQGFNQNILLWNVALGYKFLKDKALDVRVSVNDVLNQNSGIARTVTDTYVEDSRTQVLKRYLLVTATYNLKFFKKANSGASTGVGN